jgi:hypothetical protein
MYFPTGTTFGIIHTPYQFLLQAYRYVDDLTAQRTCYT